MKPISSFNFGMLVTQVRNDRGLHLGWLPRAPIELSEICLAAKRILPGYVEFVVSSARIVASRHLPFEANYWVSSEQTRHVRLIGASESDLRKI
ncbi:hypothetical protein [Phyllobacterium endophyticum]|uniref:hypothetical protein n=1 Tax=Phyllobacterium endophyticum TaxID=1149773 RepID=UPI0011CAF5D4|nr:hypothetical protein [Phyllobacterium endophyticum]TXR46680.1 hypothetical protein FVA77_23915 [Phyllobacterium endophyticum]